MTRAIRISTGSDVKLAGGIPKNINSKQTRQAGLELRFIGMFHLKPAG